MIKTIECHYCGNHMVYTIDKEMEELGWLSFKCSCGNSVLAPNNNPSIKEIEENKVTIATNEQKYKSALCMINDFSIDYDGCDTVESLKELIDEMRDIVHFVLKPQEYNITNKGEK